ncbi:C2 domain containing protein [Tritrichomonas foetus]|uniref:C2 domain containing protein n=1 Tax=Tritrichomonas foetus TaxID=1144522 RepID=A0A1J4JKB8_9EUKA|nr:C2 domain containing protein [Tritrichomonas foetus]|eukprot:OHS97684.1 C2 domain containing protein [Tritrichomonas foetus]
MFQEFLSFHLTLVISLSKMILHIKAIEGADIPKMDVAGKSDPYLKFTLSTSSQKWKTKTVNNSLTPVWNEELHLPITSSLKDELTVQLYDDDNVSKDDIISSLKFKVDDFKEGKVTDKWYNFEPAKGVKNGGKVRLVFHLDKSGKEAFKAK